MVKTVYDSRSFPEITSSVHWSMGLGRAKNATGNISLVDAALGSVLGSEFDSEMFKGATSHDASGRTK